MKRSRWGIARRCVQQPAIRWFSSRAQRPVWEESSVDGIRRGRIKLLIGFIQGDSDLDLVQNIQSVNRLRFANTRFRERVFVRFLFSLLHGQLGLTADMPQTYR